jgi:hypothetical protein
MMGCPKYNIPKEIELMVLLSFKNHDDSTKKAILNLLNDNINWGNFLKHLHHHRLIPFIYNNIQNNIYDIPAEIIQHLKTYNKNNVLKMIRLTSEIIRLLSLFKIRGIRLIPLKGPILSFQLYNNVGFRSSRDIDFLVHPKDVPGSYEMLINQGYVLSPDSAYFSSKTFKFYQKLKHNISFFHPEKKIYIELHWRLSFHNFFNFYDNQIQNLPTRKITYNNIEIEVLSDNIQLLYLAVHGSKHKWSSLYWLKDFADFAEHSNNLNEAISIAKQLNIELPVYQGIELAKMFYGLCDNTSFSKPENLINLAIQEIINPVDKSKINDIRRVFYFMKLKKSFIYKVNSLWGLFYRFFIRTYLKLNTTKGL